MTFESDFAEMMPSSVVVKTTSTLSGYGNVTFTTAGTTYAAYVEYKMRLVRAFDGTEKVSQARAIMGTTKALKVTSRYVLPDGTTPPVLAVTLPSDTGGTHHTEVYFG